MVRQDLPQRVQISTLEHGTNRLKGGVVGHKDCEIGNVQLISRVIADVAEVVRQIGRGERGVEVEEAVAAGEELEGGTEIEGTVNLVDDDAVAEFDILDMVSIYPCWKIKWGSLLQSRWRAPARRR